MKDTLSGAVLDMVYANALATAKLHREFGYEMAAKSLEGFANWIRLERDTIIARAEQSDRTGRAG